MRINRNFLLIIFIIFCILHKPISAESIFTNDGNITEGIIEIKKPNSIILRKENKIKIEIPNEMILRITNDESYKNKMLIKFKTGVSLIGHIVEKTADHAVVRKILTEKHEITIPLIEVADISQYVSPSKFEVNSGKDHKPLTRKDIDPQKAARLSLLPIYSGSFLADYNWTGLSFVVIKTFSCLLPFTVISSNFLSGSTISSESNSSGGSDIFKNNERMQRITYLSALIWLAATVGDIFYSYHYITGYNSRIPSTSTYSLHISISSSDNHHINPSSLQLSTEIVAELFSTYCF